MESFSFLSGPTLDLVVRSPPGLVGLEASQSQHHQPARSFPPRLGRVCITEEGLDPGLVQEQCTQVCDLLESLELWGWDLVAEVLRGWELVVELLQGWEVVVLQEQYTQVCDLLDSRDLWGLLLAFSFFWAFFSQVLVSTLLNLG